MLNKKLRVRNFPDSMDKWTLEDLFTSVGNVMSVEIVDGPDGTKVAWVEMASDQEAADCVERFNGYRCHDKVLVVVQDGVKNAAKKKALSKRSEAVSSKRLMDAKNKELGARIRAAIVASRK